MNLRKLVLLAIATSLSIPVLAGCGSSEPADNTPAPAANGAGGPGGGGSPATPKVD